MSRYLTAGKIGLLDLVVMYCDGWVPGDATIPILSFVASHLEPELAEADKRRSSTSTSTSTSTSKINEHLRLENFERVLTPLRKQHRDAANNLWEAFVVELWRIRDLDGLFAFFEELPELLSPQEEPAASLEPSPQEPATSLDPSGQNHRICLTTTSMIGDFVRRAVMEFDRLSFQEAVSLWQNFETYRKPTAMSNPSLTQQMEQDDLSLRWDPQEVDQLSGGRVSTLLERNLDGSLTDNHTMSSDDIEKLLQFQIDKTEKLGNTLPPDMHINFQELLKPSQEARRLSHYMRFLESWYAGDYTNSFESLHRYYDHAMLDEERFQYQYALINVAILQLDFGCYSEAIVAMDEAIITARENQDTACLNFCLEAGKKVLPGSDEENLTYLKIKAHDSNMWNLVSITLLNEARTSLSKGEGPCLAFERIYESSHLNVTHSLSSVETSKLLVHSSVFDRLGITNMSASYCNLVTDCHRNDSPAEGTTRARCRSAYTLVLAGDYSSATKALDALGPGIHRNLLLHQFVSSCIGMLKLIKALHNNDLLAAQGLVTNLRSAPRSNAQLSFQIALLEVDFLRRTGNFSDAFAKIEEMFARCEVERSDIYRRIRLMTAKVLLFSECRRPQKGLSLALRATAAAYRSKIMTALWEAVGGLAIVMVGLEQFEVAHRLLDAVIYQAPETEELALVAMLQNAKADAYVGLAGTMKDDKARRHEPLRQALEWLKQAQQSYERLQDTIGQDDATQKMDMIHELRPG